MMMCGRWIKGMGWRKGGQVEQPEEDQIYSSSGRNQDGTRVGTDGWLNKKGGGVGQTGCLGIRKEGSV